MYIWTYASNQIPLKRGFGQTPLTSISREVKLMADLTSKYGVQFDSVRGQAVVVAKLLQDRYLPRNPQDPDYEKFSKTKIAAERIASPRPWSFDELHAVEYACNIYCQLGLLPITSQTVTLNFSRLRSGMIFNPIGAPPDFWAQANSKIQGQTERPPGALEIIIYDSGIPEKGSKQEKAATVIHELAHALLRDQFYSAFSQFSSHPWTLLIPGTDPVNEDIATSIEWFLTKPEKLRKLSLRRYEILKTPLQFVKSCR